MKSTLTQLDRLECLLWLIRAQEVETAKSSKRQPVLLPSLQNPKPDQITFWENVLRVCGQKLLYIQDLGRLQQVAAQSKIINELPIHSGILELTERPEAFNPIALKRIDPGFLQNLQGFSRTIALFSRGDSPTFVF